MLEAKRNNKRLMHGSKIEFQGSYLKRWSRFIRPKLLRQVNFGSRSQWQRAKPLDFNLHLICCRYKSQLQDSSQRAGLIYQNIRSDVSGLCGFRFNREPVQDWVLEIKGTGGSINITEIIMWANTITDARLNYTPDTSRRLKRHFGICDSPIQWCSYLTTLQLCLKID